jgi:hypothetical protein
MGALDRFAGPGTTRVELVLQFVGALLAAIAGVVYASHVTEGWSWLQYVACCRRVLMPQAGSSRMRLSRAAAGLGARALPGGFSPEKNSETFRENRFSWQALQETVAFPRSH